MSKIVETINKRRGWRMKYAVARPDYKRPWVHRGNESSDNEYGIYECAMGVLEERGLIGEDTENPGLEGTDLKHWNNWCSTEKVRHTIESAKALVKMANDGKFAKWIFADGYMDEPSIEIDIYHPKGMFMLAYETHGLPHIEWAVEEEDILEAISKAPKRFTWKWVSQDGELEVDEDDEEEEEEDEEEKEEEEMED